MLGVLLISGEYSTGMIRSSLTVVPRRLPMLWGKLAVFAATVFLTMLVAGVASFLSSVEPAQRAPVGRLALRPRARCAPSSARRCT